MKLLHFVFLTSLTCSVLAQSASNQIAGLCAAVNKNKDTGKITIVITQKDRAADKAGILADDEIIQIDSKGTADMDLQSVMNMLQGESGTIVKLTIKRKGIDRPIVIDVPLGLP